jgi:hypothetical protein
LYGPANRPGRLPGDPVAVGEAGSVADAEACHPFLKPLLDYWHRIKGERGMPARVNLDPVEIGRRLPFVLLIKVLHEPLDFEYRICGEDFIDHNGHDLTRQRLREMVGRMPAADRIFDAYAEVVEFARPGTLTIDYRTRAGMRRLAHQLILPFADDEGRVGWLLVGVRFD